jgi:hypothetical protein
LLIDTPDINKNDCLLMIFDGFYDPNCLTETSLMDVLPFGDFSLIQQSGCEA